MSFLHPAALALLGLALVILALSILRARQRRREVAALALWDGLLESAPSRMTTLRYFVDLQLLLQLACLLFLTLALAEPLWHGQRTSSGAIAVVLDASASMQALTPEGRERYDVARERALAMLDSAPSAPVAVLALSETPRVLAAPSSERRAARAALVASSPTYLGDGSSSELASLLDAVGGPASYERIIVFTDHPLDDVPFAVTYNILPAGDNVSIETFSVRQNPSGSGVTAFLEVSNTGSRAVANRVTVRDESARTSVDTFLEAGDSAEFVVPFPLSRGSQFVASIDGNDALLLDDVRHASLARSLELRVRWLGDENRFLAAALAAALPILRVEPGEPADLTVAYDTELEGLPQGNVLLVHSTVPDLVEFGAPGPGSYAHQEVSDDPLLTGIEAGDVFVERIDALDISLPHRVLVSAGASTLVAHLDAGGGSVLVLNTDLYGTNLPITVDFPLLIRNYLASVARLPSGTAYRWNLVGRPVDLSTFGAVTSVSQPSGEQLKLSPGQTLFAPDTPGAYELVAGAERFPLSVNVAPSESARSEESAPASSSAAGGLFRRAFSAALWPYAAVVALTLLIAEAFVAFDTLREWRKRRAS